MSLCAAGSLAAAGVELDLEALYLQRGGSRSKTLIYQGVEPTGTKKITGRKLVRRCGYEPAFRVTLGGSGETLGGYVRALALGGWESHKKTKGYPLGLPFANTTYAPEWQNGYMADDKYKNNLTLIDAYISKTVAPLWKDYFGLKYMVGLQYFNIPASNTLNLYSQLLTRFGAPYSVKNTYTAKSHNDALLGAIGFYFQMRPVKTFALELIGYGGIGGNYATSKTKLKGVNNTLIRRSSNQDAIGMAYSFLSSVRLTYKPYEFFEISGSYEYILANGMAFAYRQMSYGVLPTSDNHVHREGTASYQGFALRIGFRL